MSKQQMKIVDMHQKLLDAGYSIGYTTVRNFVNEESAKSKEVFIRKNSEPSHEVEFDWGEVKLDIGDGFKTYQMAVFASAKGNFRYSRLFTKQDTACFNEAHALFFERISGVYRTMVYDNMKVVIINKANFVLLKKCLPRQQQA